MADPASLPEIPDLKKKEEERKKERKGAAALLSPGGSSANSLWARILPGGGGGLLGGGGAGTGLAAVFGSGAAAALAAIVGVGVLLGGGAVWYNSAGRGASKDGGPELSVEKAGIVVHRGGDERSLNMLGSANRGEIRFDEAKKPVAVAEPEKGADGKGPGDATKGPSPEEMLAQMMGKDGKGGLDAKREAFIRKMTKDTSQLMGAKGSAFAGNDIFGGGAKSTFGAKGGSIGNGAPQFDASRGKLSDKMRAKSMPMGRSVNLASARSSNAMGQLRRGMDLSMHGSNMVPKVAETGSHYAAQAFEGQTSRGGAPPAGPIGGGVGGGTPVIMPAGAGGGGGGSGDGSGGGEGAPPKCPPNMYRNGSVCVPLPSQPTGKDMSKFKWLMDTIAALLIGEAICFFIAFILGPTPVGWFFAILGLLKMAAVISLAGLLISQYGQAMLGAMYILVAILAIIPILGNLLALMMGVMQLAQPSGGGGQGGK